MQTFLKILALILAMQLSACTLVRDLGVGKGFTAKYLCSSMFVSGFSEERSIESFIKPKVRELPYIWDVQVDTDKKEVFVKDIITGNGKGARAFYTQGKGCTLLVDQTREEVEKIPFKKLPEQELVKWELWPIGPSTRYKHPFSVDYKILNPASDILFNEIYESELNTTALVIAHKGELVFERYGKETKNSTPTLGWSMTKTITGMMIGLLADDGLLDLDKPAPIPEWKGTDKEAITTRQLLNMASGIENFEEYGGLSDVSRMLYLESDQYEFALGQKLVNAPGSNFDYSTPEANRLAAVVHNLLGGQQEVYEFFQTRIAQPLNITSATIEFDTQGHFVGGAYSYMDARDWARLGLVYLNGGEFNGQQIFSKEWVEFATFSSPNAAHYGAQLWINANGERWKNLPHDIFYYMGHQGQRVIMVPSKDLVIVRTGVTEDYNLQVKVIKEFLEAALPAFPDKELL